MRYIAAYFLMLFYLLVMFKPLIPVICDAWAHIFAEAEHIATVHAKYGSNHLDADLVKEGADNDNSKPQHTARSEESYTTHLIIEECKFDFSFNSTKIYHCLLHSSDLRDTFLPKLFPPPKFA